MISSDTSLVLIRHGETTENLNRIFQGQLQTRLSDTGIKQAKKLSSLFPIYTSDTILCSTALRCKQTAKLLVKNKYHKINFSDALQERSFGKLEGRSSSEIRSEYKLSLDSDISHIVEEESEDINLFEGRVINHVKLWINQPKNLGRTIIITHLWVIRCIAKYFYLKVREINNCAIIRIPNHHLQPKF